MEKIARIALASSASVTSTMRLTLARMIASASTSGLRQAMPSASTVSTGASTARFAEKDLANAGACADTTPTIRVRGE
jgi:hypothetical protein